MRLQVVQHSYQPYGAIWDLFWDRDIADDEILIEGPAGTGKTRGVLEYVYMLCEEYPGIRWLFARATRKSMTESVLELWEDWVLPPGHPCKTGKATRANRGSYTFPNGSHIVICGLDNPDRIMSAQFDGVSVFEATELPTADAWEKLTSRLRNHRIRDSRFPSGYMERAIADCNPKQASHWLNRRADEPHPEPHYKGQRKMRRLMSRHVDNPSVTPDYLRKLRAMTGHRRDRLYLGKWVSASGMVWPMWDENIHVVTGSYEKDDNGRGTLTILRDWDTDGSVRYEKVPIEWTCAGMDFGYRDPTVIQVYGVDHMRRLWCLAEVYRTEMRRQWWADRLMELTQEYEIQVLWADHDPEEIEVFNDRIGSWGGHDNDRRFARLATKDRGLGIAQMADLLQPEHSVGPRMYWLRDRFPYGFDEERQRNHLPVKFEEEIESYVWRELAEDVRSKDEPDPDCEEHACDVARYVACGVWRRDLAAPRPKIYHGVETYGEVLGYDEDELRSLFTDLQNGHG